MHIFNDCNPDSPLVGDFEGFYAEVEDPWEQSGTNTSSKMYPFYKFSRQHLADFLSSQKFLSHSRVLEIGCGHGYVLPYIQESMPLANVTGVDISSHAINTAKTKNPGFSYICANIIRQHITPTANVIILSNLLWYVIEDIKEVCQNLEKSIDHTCPAKIIIYNAFFREPGKYYTIYSNAPDKVRDLFVNSLPSNIRVNSSLIDTRVDPSLCYDSGIISLSIGCD